MNIKPTALKVLEGKRQYREVVANEPTPTVREPVKTKALDPEALRTWKKLAKKLVRLGLLTEVDGESFSDLCQIRSRILACRKFLNEQNESLMQETKFIDGSGQEHTTIKASAYVKLENELMGLWRKYAHDFGLTPRGRSGLSVGGGKGKQGIERLID